MRLCPWVLLLCFGTLLSVCGVTAAGDPAPWVGTWRLDPARSTQRQAASPYKRVTLAIAPHGDGLRVVYDMVGTRGGVTHIEWTGALDGRDYQVQGVDTVMTHAYSRVDDHSYTIAVKVEGNPVATATATVSPDGRTLSVVQRERDANGTPATSTTVYARQ